jgi:hypothetical protein
LNVRLSSICQRSGGHGQVDENRVPLQDLYETPNELVDTIIDFISYQLNPMGILPNTFFDPAVGNGAIVKRLFSNFYFIP